VRSASFRILTDSLMAMIYEIYNLLIKELIPFTQEKT